jgi:hypothetical protein
MPPFSGWIARLPFAETAVDRRFAVPDRVLSCAGAFFFFALIGPASQRLSAARLAPA